MSSTLDVEVLWKGSLPDLVNGAPTTAQRQWLEATHPVGYSNDTVILATPNDFVRQWLDEHYSQRIRETLSGQAGRPIGVVIMVEANGGERPAAAAVSEDPSVALPPRSVPPEAHEPPTPVDAPTAFGRTDQVRPAPPTEDGQAGAHRSSLGAHPYDPPASAPRAPGQPAPHRQEPPAAHEVDRATDEPRNFETTSARPLDAPGRPPGDSVLLPERRQIDTEVEPDTQLNPKYVFDSFVIGASNRFAHAAAFAVAETPAKAYNPLFIYGESGLGKTHLLHAVGHYVRHLYPRLRVRYVTTEQFTNEFITAVRDARMADFQRLYRQIDILLVDDIQFLGERERTQEEFFHTFNALHNAEKQIVISSDRPPRQIARLEDRLRSRFEWGLMTDVQPPDLETRIAILRRKSATERLDITDDVLEFIASRVQSNIRELEGALIRVAAYASLQGKAPDGEMAERVLKDLFPEEGEQHVNVHMIMEEVAPFFDFTVEELTSKSRTRKLSTARQIAMYLTRELTDMSLPKIGDAFGGRDHSTVLHANNKIADLMGERRQIYDQVMELTNRIKTRARHP